MTTCMHVDSVESQLMVVDINPWVFCSRLIISITDLSAQED